MPSKMVKVWIDSDEFYPFYYYTEVSDKPGWRDPRKTTEVPEEFLKEFDEAVERIGDLMDRMGAYSRAL